MMLKTGGQNQEAFLAHLEQHHKEPSQFLNFDLASFSVIENGIKAFGEGEF